VRHAFQIGWSALCVDQGPDQLMRNWSDRDYWMARNLLDQWPRACPAAGVIAICGNLHARLRPVELPFERFWHLGDRLWPSFAGWLQLERPELRVHSVLVAFAGGSAYFNGAIHKIGPVRPPGSQPRLRAPLPEYTLELELPEATPATFLTPPSPWRASPLERVIDQA
jgi:hypothetical protein